MESESEESESEDEDAPKAPNKLVVQKWMKVLPKKEATPKTEVHKLCETLLMKNID